MNDSLNEIDYQLRRWCEKGGSAPTDVLYEIEDIYRSKYDDIGLLKEHIVEAANKYGSLQWAVMLYED